MANQEFNREHDQPEYERSPPILEGPINALKEAQARKDEEDRQHRNLQRKFDLLLVVFTGVTALVGAAQGYLTWQAIDVAQRQAASAERSNVLTRQSMKYAYIQSRQAAKQNAIDNELSRQQSKAALDASIDASRTDQRAWLGVASPILPTEPEAGKPFRLTVTIKNVGRTPALDISFKSCAGFFFPLQTGINPPACKWREIPTRKVPTTTEFPGMSHEDLEVATPEVSIAEAAAYRAHQSRVFARCRFDYKDVFRRPHFTEICYYHQFGTDPAKYWSSCNAEVEYDQNYEARQPVTPSHP